jgi:hypothetical protein
MKRTKSTMTKLTRFFATCLLVASISAVALADGEGGVTQGVPHAAALPPPAECTTDCSITAASEPVPDSSFDIVSAEDMLKNWLVAAIF